MNFHNIFIICLLINAVSVNAQNLQSLFLNKKKYTSIDIVYEEQVKFTKYDHQEVELNRDRLIDQSTPESTLISSFSLDEKDLNKVALEGEQRTFRQIIQKQINRFNLTAREASIENWFMELDYRLSYKINFPRVYIRVSFKQKNTSRCGNEVFLLIQKNGKWLLNTNEPDKHWDLKGLYDLRFYDSSTMERIFSGDHRNEEPYLKMYKVLCDDRRTDIIYLNRLNQFHYWPYIHQLNSCSR